METHKLSDIKIKVCIVPRRLRWPESGTSIAWAKAHGCVNALQDLVRSVDVACIEAEQSRDLSSDAIGRRRAELCEQALKRLMNFPPFGIAEKAVSENVASLERLSDRSPKQVEVLEKLEWALNDLREGIGATRRMLLERCKMREGVSV